MPRKKMSSLTPLRQRTSGYLDKLRQPLQRRERSKKPGLCTAQSTTGQPRVRHHKIVVVALNEMGFSAPYRERQVSQRPSTPPRQRRHTHNTLTFSPTAAEGIRRRVGVCHTPKERGRSFHLVLADAKAFAGYFDGKQTHLRKRCALHQVGASPASRQMNTGTSASVLPRQATHL